MRPWDRTWYRTCRRAWDFGSRQRRNLEPAHPTFSVDLDRALRDALAVYYFPGMWEWDRSVVLPLTRQALERAMSKQRDSYPGLTEEQAARWESELETGRQLLDHYLEWAPALDRFWPVRVETDFDVQVPDWRSPGEDLVVPGEGEAIRYQGRVDLLVVDEHDAYWVVRHRLAHDGFCDPYLLVLDDELLAAAWAWEIFYLGMRVAGTIHNELRPGVTPPDPAAPVRRPRASHAFARARAAARTGVRGVPEEPGVRGAPQENDEAPATTAPVAGHRRMYVRAERTPTDVVVEEGGDMFRRTRIPRSTAELEGLGRNLGQEALEMADPHLVPYPTPGGHCAECVYRPPCLTLQEGDNVEPILTARYRTRPDEVPEEGRLGAVTWSMNRGAAPPPQWRGRA
ncbi:MAG TPA: hypothetical protein VGL92_04540 [Acidimicrobiia bacterium]